MSDIGIFKDFPSPHIFGLYIDEVETYLNKINGILHAYSTQWLPFFLYADDVVLLSRSKVGM